MSITRYSIEYLQNFLELREEGETVYISSGIKIRGGKHPCCQDALCQGQYETSDGGYIWYGAIADGCGSAVGSQYGAAFLVSEYERAVTELYEAGLRGEELLEEIAIRLCESMFRYDSVCAGSEIFSYAGNVISAELTATVYGYVADCDRIVLLLAGDGYIGINGIGEIIDQHNEAVYPVYLLQTPMHSWRSNLNQVFHFVNMPTYRVDNLVLATDGFYGGNEYSRLFHDPNMLTDKIEREASRFPFPKHRSDDTSLLSLAKTDNWSSDPLPLDATNRIKRSLEDRSVDQVLSLGAHIETQLIRKECEDPFANEEVDSSLAGITVYPDPSWSLEKQFVKHEPAEEPKIAEPEAESPFVLWEEEEAEDSLDERERSMGLTLIRCAIQMRAMVQIGELLEQLK
ncbi:MAG: protein phosphatase 2C domain-containing protein [Candidatus Berkelbacteria bacterium]|nr:protein phosphatase 2C domain-containing protein [Candidatus Berkelbacteria bacterium]